MCQSEKCDCNVLSFGCRKCEENIGVAVEQREKLFDAV